MISFIHYSIFILFHLFSFPIYSAVKKIIKHKKKKKYTYIHGVVYSAYARIYGAPRHDYHVTVVIGLPECYYNYLLFSELARELLNISDLSEQPHYHGHIESAEGKLELIC